MGFSNAGGVSIFLLCGGSAGRGGGWCENGAESAQRGNYRCDPGSCAALRWIGPNRRPSGSTHRCRLRDELYAVVLAFGVRGWPA